MSEKLRAIIFFTTLGVNGYLSFRQQAACVDGPVVPARVTELEIDEMWTFVGKKANCRWLWYGFDVRHLNAPQHLL